MASPPEAMHPNRAAVLAAVTHLWLTGERITVREICAWTGLRSTSTVNSHLHALAEAGLVAYELGLAATARPSFGIVR